MDAARENLALYRPATASSIGHYPVVPEFAVDGEADTGWRSGRDAGGSDWLSVDLQASCRIEAIIINWSSRAALPVFEEVRTTSLFGAEQVASYGVKYSVWLSADGTNWGAVYSTTLGDGGEDIVHVSPQQARYVRVMVTERSHPKFGVGINEIAVLGACSTERPAGQSWKLRRKAKTAPVLAQARAADRELLLNTGWELTREDWVHMTAAQISDPALDTGAWYNAIVPGTVLATLVEQEVFPEPTIGTNCLQIPDSLCRHVWWYRTKLIVPESWTRDGQQLWLDFDGINYVAEVWLNGRRLSTINGAFTRGCFGINDALNVHGDNVLAVRILPPAHPGVPLEKSDEFSLYNGGALGKDSPTFVASIGWDWMAPVRDRGIGIWSDVRVRRTGDIVIGDPKVVTDLPLPDTSRADISITVPVDSISDQTREVTVTAEFEGVSISKTVSVEAQGSLDVDFTPAEYSELTVKNPKLWWPVGYGDQPLYDLKLSADIGGRLSDVHTLHFGIRELSYLGKKLNPRPLESDEQPDELEISVNGQRVFCRGGNWGYPEILLRMSDERMETAVRLHHEANMNMIRNWVGQNTVKKFYDLCDRYGILVWNDFWLANPVDGPDPDNPDLFLRNVKDVVLRYRNHPSIAVWCGRNEGMPPEVLDKGMRRLTDELDGTRYYQSHSSDVGVNGHGPYKYVAPVEYFKGLTRGFKTEIGMPSVPSAESMRRMLDDPDPWPLDGRWSYHDFAPKGNQFRDEYVKAVNTKFGPAANLDDFCRKAQMINYDGYRAIFESCNHKLWNDCSGLLLWMSHPAWPSTVWQVYDYWYGTDGAFFGAKKANEPVHVQYCPLNDTVELINHTAAPLTGTVTATVIGLNASILWRHSAPVTAQKNSKTDAFNIERSETLPSAYLLKLQWLDASGRLLSDNTYWLSARDSDLQALSKMPQVKLRAEVSYNDQNLAAVKLTNDSKNVALMTTLVLRDAETGERILPAYYSDNYLSLLPGEARTVTVGGTEKDAAKKVKISVAGWNIEPMDVQ